MLKLEFKVLIDYHGNSILRLHYGCASLKSVAGWVSHYDGDVIGC